MKPITHQRARELEFEVRYSVCPLTVEVTHPPRSFLAGEDRLTGYKCAKDFGPARGGVQSTNGLSEARTPCSLEFAVGCPVYKTHAHLLAVVYPELIAENPSAGH